MPNYDANWIETAELINKSNRTLDRILGMFTRVDREVRKVTFKSKGELHYSLFNIPEHLFEAVTTQADIDLCESNVEAKQQLSELLGVAVKAVLLWGDALDVVKHGSVFATNFIKTTRSNRNPYKVNLIRDYICFDPNCSNRFIHESVHESLQCAYIALKRPKHLIFIEHE